MKVRVVRPWGPFDLEVDGYRFSTGISEAEADALLCEWSPTEELFDFDGPAAWYICEPRTNPRMGVLREEDQRRCLARARPDQLLHHAHPDPRFRVPHITHTDATLVGPGDASVGRVRRACAVVSNFGGPRRNRWPDIELRNRFITASGVDLFGRRSKWKHYREQWWSLPRLPSGFAGEIPDGTPKLSVVARYRVAICLENTCEPGYFSEKFVDAVRAGCVPVYRAHPSVRETVLRGAIWVDPADFGLDPEATFAHAFSLDRESVAARNAEWLHGEAARATREDRVWATIGAALRAQSETRVASRTR